MENSFYTKLANENYIKFYEDNEIEISESGELLKQYLKENGLSKQHVEIYDHWIQNYAETNITQKELKISESKKIVFENFQILPPYYVYQGKKHILTPQYAREKHINYSSDWIVDVILVENGIEIDRKKSVIIGNIPIMLKSKICYLRDKSNYQLQLLGEDHTDPGGYFIMSGAEKLILLQEQLTLNKFFIMKMNMKSLPIIRILTSSERNIYLNQLKIAKESKQIIKYILPSTKVNIVRKQRAINEKKNKSVNVLRFYRYYGITNLEEIQDRILIFIPENEREKSLYQLHRTILDYSIHTNDVDVIVNKIDRSVRKNFVSDEKEKEVNKLLDKDFFPYLNNPIRIQGETQDERRKRMIDDKLTILSIMIAKFIRFLAGFVEIDNRDSWSNKRLQSAGSMMENLLKKAWNKTIQDIETKIRNDYVREFDRIVELIRDGLITDSFNDSFKPNNWGIKSGTSFKAKVTDILARESILSTLSHLNTVDVNIQESDKQQSIRLVQNSQFCFICPIYTPESKKVGILKNLSILTTLSIDMDEKTPLILRHIIGDKDLGLKQRIKLDYDKKYETKLLYNSRFLGWCKGEKTKRFLIQMKRQGSLPLQMSVIKENDWLYIDTSPSRVMRPCLIVDEEDQQLIIDKLNIRGEPFHKLFVKGAIEYLSPWEQEYAKLATSKSEIEKRSNDIQETKNRIIEFENLYKETNDKKYSDQIEIEKRTLEIKESVEPYTHCEIDAKSLLSIAGNLIPWPDHNQAPRNTYQTNMGKQAFSIYHTNHLNRFEGNKTKVLCYPNRPMVETEIHGILGLNQRGQGKNINVMFGAFPYTEEDSFIFKKEFLENGGFRFFKYLSYKTVVEYSPSNFSEKLERPKLKTNNESKFASIQENGLPKIGSFLTPGDCVISKVRYYDNNKSTPSNESEYLKVGEEGIVEKISIVKSNENLRVNIKIRIIRIPQEGDKFAARNAQKGTIGKVISQKYLPTDKFGIAPDMIVNTHAIPSRMTISYPIEIISSKYGSIIGKHINGSAFKKFVPEEYVDKLKEYNFDEFSYETMRSGTTGEILNRKMYGGPCFIQLLKHHVLDKFQIRDTGEVQNLMRQPIKGRGNKGGLKIGEMEKDAIVSHGASSFLLERLMYVSDAYQAVFCKICGTFAINDPYSDIGYKRCKFCGNETEFGKKTIPYPYKLLEQLLAGMGIRLNLKFMYKNEYIDYYMKKSKEKVDIKSDIINEDDDEDEQNEQDDLEEELNGETEDIYEDEFE